MKYLAAAAIALTLASYNAHSNAANPILSQLGEFGGAAEAAITACGMEFDVKAAKRQQQEQFILMGGTSDQFEAAYKSGYDRASKELKAATAAERQTMCDEFKKLAAQIPSP